MPWELDCMALGSTIPVINVIRPKLNRLRPGTSPAISRGRGSKGVVLRPSARCSDTHAR